VVGAALTNLLGNFFESGLQSIIIDGFDRDINRLFIARSIIEVNS
jgi:hypothetical protein